MTSVLWLGAIRRWGGLMRRHFLGVLALAVSLAAFAASMAASGGYGAPADQRYTSSDDQSMFAPAIQCEFAGWSDFGEDPQLGPKRLAHVDCEDQNGHEWTEYWFAWERYLEGLDHGECKPGNSGGRGPAAEGNRTSQWEQWLAFKCDDGTTFTLVLGDSHIFNLIANPVLNDILPQAAEDDS